MGRILDYFKNFKKNYDAQIIRNQKMDEFLSGAHDNCVKIDGITHAMEKISEQVTNLDNKVTDLQSHVGKIDGRLETIERGTKMELFDTLYNWKKILTARGWKTKAEMDEIKEIYQIYHDKLGGNGQGEHYYKEIEELKEVEVDDMLKSQQEETSND